MSGQNGWKGERRPAFPLYAADWLLNGRTRAIGPDGRGVYIDLLCLQWREGHVDEGDISTALGDPMTWPSPNRRVEILGFMLAAFPECDDGLRRNSRLERERAILEERRAEMVAGGQAGARARWGSNGQAMGRPMASDGSSSSSKSSSKSKSEEPPNPRLRGKPPVAADVDHELEAYPVWVQSATRSWLSYREERRLARFKPKGLRALCSRIESLGAARAAEAVRHSMAQNYQGLYEPGGGGGSGSPGGNGKLSAHDAIRAELAAQRETA